MLPMGGLPYAGVAAIVKNVDGYMRDIGKMNAANAKLDKSLAEATDETEKAALAAKRNSAALQGLATKVGVAVGAVAALAAAYKGWLELSVQVAKAEQTAAAFDRLTSSLGAGSDALEVMRQQSDGLISDLDLMRLTSMALAGTSETMGKALLQSNGQLLGIAQAAGVLNPRLGDTATVYERLIGAIKKQEKELLDELGIVFSAAEEQKRYADALGKTTDELTAGERQQAFLNAVLREGSTLTGQAADVQSEYLKTFQQSQVALTNFSDAVKRRIPLAILPSSKAIDGLNAHVERLNKLTDHGITIDSLGRYRQHGEVIAENTAQADRFLATYELVNDERRQGIEALRLVTRATEASTEATQANADAADAARDANREYFDSLAGFGSGIFEKLGKIGQFEALGGAQQLQLEASVKLALEEGELSTVEKQLLGKTAEPLELFYQFAEKGGAVEDVGALTKMFTEAGFTKGEAGAWAAQISVDASGFVAEQQAALTTMLNDMTAPIDFSGTADNLNRQLLAPLLASKGVYDKIVDKSVTIALDWEWKYGAPPPGFQHGGSFIVGGKGGIDSNMVMFRATRGERVTVTPAAQVANTYNQQNNSRVGVAGNVNIGTRDDKAWFDRQMRDWLGG